MSAADRDKARDLLRGWQAEANSAGTGNGSRVGAAIAYALLDLADALRGPQGGGSS